jgi:hypothetical protein
VRNLRSAEHLHGDINQPAAHSRRTAGHGRRALPWRCPAAGGGGPIAAHCSDFDSLTIGINLVLGRGARLVVTNPDASVDDTTNGQHRMLPGGGALLAPIACAVEPLMTGKPEPALFEMACRRLRLTTKRPITISDRPDTDVAGALRIGVRATRDPTPPSARHRRSEMCQTRPPTSQNAVSF